MITTTELRKFAEGYTAAWCSHDAARVSAFYSAEGWLRINEGDPAVGRSAIAQAAREFMTTFPDLQVILDDFVVDNENAVYRWTLFGSNTGPGGTGKPQPSILSFAWTTPGPTTSLLPGLVLLVSSNAGDNHSAADSSGSARLAGRRGTLRELHLIATQIQ